MILQQLQTYLRQHSRTSLQELICHFQIEAEALRGMLDVLICKGRVRKLEGKPGDSYRYCVPESLELYEWHEAIRDRPPIDRLERQSQECDRTFFEQVRQLEQQIVALEAEKESLQQENKKLKATPAQLKPTDLTPARAAQSQPPTLESDREVNYTRLRNWLAEGKWREANEETYQVMLKAAQREGNYLRVEDIDNFPSTDLQTIDRLWVHYSGGCFGFSIQLEIYRRHGGTQEYNRDVWLKFADEVGWRVDGKVLLNYSQLNFSFQTVVGHLPWVASYFARYRQGALFSRAVTCGLASDSNLKDLEGTAIALGEVSDRLVYAPLSSNVRHFNWFETIR